MRARMRDKELRRASLLQQNDSSEIIKRWRQLRVVCAKTGGYREAAAKNMMAQRQKSLLGGVQIIWAMSSLVTLFIASRIGLKLITLDAGTPFGRFVVALTDLFLRPFSGFTETLTTTHITVLELSALNAIIIYPFAAWCLVKLLQFLYAPSRSR